MREKKWFGMLVTVVICLGLAASAMGQATSTVLYQQGVTPTAAYAGCTDAHIMIYSAGNNNNGSSYFLEEGDWSGSGNVAANTDGKMPLIRFALDGLTAGTSVTQARLRIYHWQSRQPTQAATTLYVSRLLKEWNEGAGGDQDGRDSLAGEVNWYWAKEQQVRWEMGGARGPTDMAPPESSSIVSATTLNTWIEWDVTQMVRFWVANPTANYGLKIAQDPAVGTSATMWVRGLPGFYSRNYTTNISLRPILSVQTYRPPTTKPAAPSNLAAELVAGWVLVSWADNSTDEQAFKLERKTGTGAFVEIAQPGANSTSYLDMAVAVGTTYTYRILAYNAAGDSAYSNEATVTVTQVLGVRKWHLYGN